MGVVAAGLMLVGSAASASGAIQEGEATHAAARYTARLATMESNEEANRIREIGRRRRSVNITRVAKSGVRLEGSPLAVLVDNAYQIERQAQSQARAGRAASILYRMQGQSARMAARAKATSALLTGAGSALGAQGGFSGFADGGLGASSSSFGFGSSGSSWLSRGWADQWIPKL